MAGSWRKIWQAELLAHPVGLFNSTLGYQPEVVFPGVDTQIGSLGAVSPKRGDSFGLIAPVRPIYAFITPGA
jgi:hypothetical protein